jgi:hypothetical protein
MFCGEVFYTNLVCGNGHYVCDDCHTERAIEMITDVCRKTKKREAINIAYELLMNKWMKLHGTEHHYLVAAVLLTAYKNRGYSANAENWSFVANLSEAKNRTTKIPAGACGYFGCSGEAIACGIFASVVLKATPMSVKERGAANLLTSKALEEIAMFGGPRCSKRDTFTAIFTASRFTDEYWKKPLSEFEGVECMFSDRNQDCIKQLCPFHPKQDDGHNCHND